MSRRRAAGMSRLTRDALARQAAFIPTVLEWDKPDGTVGRVDLGPATHVRLVPGATPCPPPSRS